MEDFLKRTIAVLILLIAVYPYLKIPTERVRCMWAALARFTLVHLIAISIIRIHSAALAIFGEVKSTRFFLKAFLFTSLIYLATMYYSYSTYIRVNPDEVSLAFRDVVLSLFDSGMPTVSYLVPSITVSFLSFAVTYTILGYMQKFAEQIDRAKRGATSAQSANKTVSNEALEKRPKKGKHRSKLFVILVGLLALDIVFVFVFAGVFAALYGFINIFIYVDEKTLRQLMDLMGASQIKLALLSASGMFLGLPSSLMAALNPVSNVDVVRAYDFMVLGAAIPTLLHVAITTVFVVFIKIEYAIQVPANWISNKTTTTWSRMIAIALLLIFSAQLYFGLI